MTLGEIVRQGKGMLFKAGNQNPTFDAVCLFQKVFGLDHQALLVHSNELADTAKIKEYLKRVEERASGRPLQYIIGKWPFMELELLVGEGVLIPREETELLVYTAAALLKNTNSPRILDLCSGTGAVALGLASLLPNARVTAAELYDKAFDYLKANIKVTGFLNVTPVQLDILNPQSTESFCALDCIVSNPPYIITGELPTLQIEVQNEPSSALDGGADGLAFYRTIAALWLPRLRSGGVVAVEVGEGQAAAVATLFEAVGLTKMDIMKDFNGIERVVSGIWQEHF